MNRDAGDSKDVQRVYDLLLKGEILHEVLFRFAEDKAKDHYKNDHEGHMTR